MTAGCRAVLPQLMTAESEERSDKTRADYVERRNSMGHEAVTAAKTERRNENTARIGIEWDIRSSEWAVMTL